MLRPYVYFASSDFQRAQASVRALRLGFAGVRGFAGAH